MANGARRRKTQEPDARSSGEVLGKVSAAPRQQGSRAFRFLAGLVVLAGVVALALFMRNGSSPETVRVVAEDWLLGRPFAVQDLPGRGKGLVATRDIEVRTPSYLMCAMFTTTF
jgi:hypothetical protein